MQSSSYQIDASQGWNIYGHLDNLIIEPCRKLYLAKALQVSPEVFLEP